MERYHNNLREIEEILNQVNITSKNRDGSYKTIFMILSEVSDVFNELNNEICKIEECVNKYREIMNLPIWIDDEFTTKAKQKIQSNIIILDCISIRLVGNRYKNELICLLLELHNI